MGPTALLPLRRKACWGFFRPKNPTASAGCVCVYIYIYIYARARTTRTDASLVYVPYKVRRNKIIEGGVGLRCLECCTAQACGWFTNVSRQHTGPIFKGQVMGPSHRSGCLKLNAVNTVLRLFIHLSRQSTRNGHRHLCWISTSQVLLAINQLNAQILVL